MTSLVIGIGGRLTAGKDAFADHLVKEHGFVKLGMSDTLAEALYRLNPLIMSEALVATGPNSCEVADEVRYQQLVNEIGYVEAKKNPEVRRLLQVLGTEVGRQLLGENIWVEAAKNKILEAGPRVAITGIRYANELRMIEALNQRDDYAGTTVWIDRPGIEAGGHSSEGSLSSQDFEYILDNTGTLEELHVKASHLLSTIEDDFL